MKTAVVYLHVVGLNADYNWEIEKESGTYEFGAERFITTYRACPAEADHELVVVFTNGEPKNLKMYDGIKARFLFYSGPRWCTGVHQWAAHRIDADFAVFSSARTHFYRRGWLKRLVFEREKHGDGFFGTTSSYEAKPHLRTNFYALNPEAMRAYPHPLETREDTWRFESGDHNVSRRFHDEGKPSLLVTWDGAYPSDQWRTPPAIFRRGDQSNLLVHDRHTDIYAMADDDTRRRLEQLSDTLT